MSSEKAYIIQILMKILCRDKREEALLADLEETAFLEVESNGMSGTNPGYYLYWVKYPDGTEQEINVRL